jgi:hypothetical protein
MELLEGKIISGFDFSFINPHGQIPFRGFRRATAPFPSSHDGCGIAIFAVGGD